MGVEKFEAFFEYVMPRNLLKRKNRPLKKRGRKTEEKLAI